MTWRFPRPGDRIPGAWGLNVAVANGWSSEPESIEEP